MRTATTRVALSWLPQGQELETIRAALPDNVAVMHPDEQELGWSRFDCRPDRLAELLVDADALMGWAAPTREALLGAGRLRFVAWLHAGCDQLDLRMLRDRQVRVANVRGANATAVAEHTMAMVLGLAKRLRQNDQAAREVRWQGWWDPAVTSIELQGTTMCLLGYGSLGRSIARLSSAFGMRVLAVRRGAAGTQSEADIVVGGPDQAKEFISAADFTILAMPLTSETKGYIDDERLSWMKRGAYLVNVARGDIVQERALHDALVSGRLAGFAGDVWWSYPDVMPPGYHFSMPSRLGVHRLPNVLASTDSAANVLAVKDRMIAFGVESLVAFVRGGEIPRLVDPDLGY
jgi:phosphoglycerate dehydrogenase-like enzyme